MKKIIEDPKNILFVCIMYINEKENKSKNNKSNLYVVYNLDKSDFYFEEIHSNNLNEYIYSIKRKYQLN